MPATTSRPSRRSPTPAAGGPQPPRGPGPTRGGRGPPGDFRLTPGGTIHGRVIARDSGQPVAGVRVSAGGGHGGRRGDDEGLGGGAATSDLAGEFPLRGGAPGALSLTARGRGYGTRE